VEGRWRKTASPTVVVDGIRDRPSGSGEIRANHRSADKTGHQLLVAILEKPELLHEVPQLETDDFVDYRFRAIFSAIRNVAASQQPVDDYDGIADPTAKVDPFDTKTHRTYTFEQPNAFELEDVGRFLHAMRVRWSEHYAMVYLGTWTGWRPSMLRPLRRRGPNADINWQTGELFGRRSHTIGNETMLGTKNGFDPNGLNRSG
jgi:hypothetical protein